MIYALIKKLDKPNYVIAMKHQKEIFTIYQICYYKDIILMINYYNLKLY